jgi:hypothetical protein
MYMDYSAWHISPGRGGARHLSPVVPWRENRGLKYIIDLAKQVTMCK